jgi:hypothetical protein
MAGTKAVKNGLGCKVSGLKLSALEQQNATLYPTRDQDGLRFVLPK